MPVTSAPSRTRSVQRGEVAERRVALQEVVPGPPDLRDLPEVVHHVDRVEAGRLGRRGDLGQPAGGRRRLEAVRAEVQPEPQPGRASCCRRAAGAAATNAVGTTRTGRGASTASNPSVGSSSRVAAQRPQLAGEHVGRDALGPAPVARPALRGRRVEGDRHARQAVLAGPARARPAGASRRGRACRSPWSAAGAIRCADDLLEQRERVGAGGEVVLAGADQRPQPVARHDRVRPRSASAAQVDFPDAPGPTSTTTHGDGRFSASATRPVCSEEDGRVQRERSSPPPSPRAARGCRMRVLVGSWPAYGHLLPMLPLVRAAQRAGHDVVGDLRRRPRAVARPARRRGARVRGHARRVVRADAGPQDDQRAAAGGAGRVRGAAPLRCRRRRPGPRPGRVRRGGGRTWSCTTRWSSGRRRSPPRRGIPHVTHGYGPMVPDSAASRRRSGRRSPPPGCPTGPGRVGRAVPRRLPAGPARRRAEPVADDPPAAPVGGRGRAAARCSDLSASCRTRAPSTSPSARS